jgi:hypothetical protein
VFPDTFHKAQFGTKLYEQTGKCYTGFHSYFTATEIMQ